MKKITYKALNNRVKKTDIIKFKKNTGGVSSLKFTDRLISSLIMLLFFLPMIYLDGVGFASAGKESSGDINIISVGTAQALSVIGKFTTPFLFLIIFVLLFLSVVNLFPKKNLARQIFWGTIYLGSFCCGIVIVFMNFLFGFTLGAFGVLGFIVQLAFGIYLLFVSLKKRKSEMKAILFDGKTFQGWKKFSSIFLVLSVAIILLNHFTFKWGYSGLDPKPMELLTGWGVLAWVLITIGFIKMLYKQTLLSYFIAKYDDQFYGDLQFTDEEWYGKRKAKRIQKKGEKKGEVK